MRALKGKELLSPKGKEEEQIICDTCYWSIHPNNASPCRACMGRNKYVSNIKIEQMEVTDD